MCLARIQFKPLKKISQSKLVDLTEDFFRFLLRNGQIMGEECSSAWQNGVLNCYVEVPRPDSLASHYHSEWVQNSLHKLREYLGGEPEWNILDDHPSKRYPQLKSSSFLYLCSNPFECSPPIHRGNDGQTIPLYLLPIDQCDRQRIYFWNKYEQACQYLWYQCGALEIPTYRQLADPRSEHCKEGRDLCRTIEEATHIPTYFYLYRYWGRKKGEETRPCPICGKKWRATEIGVKPRKFWDFKFKCDHCRIVAHRGVSDDIARHAKIGEFRK